MAESIDDIDTLARTIYGEARGEGRLGMRAVAHTIMNRMMDSRWPDTIKEVCRQPLQFSCWNEGGDGSQLQRLEALTFAGLSNAGVWGVASDVALLIDQGDPTNQANHYLTESLMWADGAPSWANPRGITAVIGRHVFLRL